MTSMEQTDFANLTPDRVIDAVESLGYVSDLRVLHLTVTRIASINLG